MALGKVERNRADRRSAITAAACELLETEGPEAITTRRIAERIGSSTMKVYSTFNSLSDVVAAVVNQGFQMLGDELALEPGPDPLADIWQVFQTYRTFALAHPHLFRAMYATVAIAGHIRTGDELLIGTPVFLQVVTVAERAIRAGLLADTPAYDLAYGAWAAVHGMVLIELAGYTGAMPAPSTPAYPSLVRVLLLGAGADPAAVDAALG